MIYLWLFLGFDELWWDNINLKFLISGLGIDCENSNRIRLDCENSRKEVGNRWELIRK